MKGINKSIILIGIVLLVGIATSFSAENAVDLPEVIKGLNDILDTINSINK